MPGRVGAFRAHAGGLHRRHGLQGRQPRHIHLQRLSQRGPELLAALADPVAVQQGRQRRIDEACRDQVDPDGRDLEREGLGQCGKRGRKRGDEREARCRALAAGGANEQQGAPQTDLARGVPGDLQRQQEVGVNVAACRVEVELR